MTALGTQLPQAYSRVLMSEIIPYKFVQQQLLNLFVPPADFLLVTHHSSHTDSCLSVVGERNSHGRWWTAEQ